MRIATPVALVTAAALLPLTAPAAHAAGPLSPRVERVARQTLAPDDGWAAHEGGTTGGSAAKPADVHVVRDWAQLRAALSDPDSTPRIVAVDGTIHAAEGPDGQAPTCADYADPAYDKEAYLATYDPAHYTEAEITGPLEEARQRSARNQAESISVDIGSNTTLIGLGDDARIVGASITIRDADNVIVRNLAFESPRDCFPHWEPGEWNAEYDGLTVRNSTHVWVDHNEFSDGAHPDSANEEHWGYEYQVHDGLLDVVDGSDLVTLSYNVFADHDKTMLIGNTDRPDRDRGRLRVTLHHNRFDNILQRAPRVRYGQVHVYNNHYVVPAAPEGEKEYVYSWGVGVESMIYARNNRFDLGEGIEPAQVVRAWGGTAIDESNTLVNGVSRWHRVDLLAAHNAAHDPDLGSDVGWRPERSGRVDPASSVAAKVGARAGTGRIL
ncbi:pectate lyase [Marinactinospora endophytica]